jgi:hypothetical protein
MGEPCLEDMDGFGEKVRQSPNELRGEIGVEQGASMGHAPTPGQGGIGIYGGKVFLLDVRVVLQDFFLGHAGCEHIQHVPYRNPETANTGLSGSLARDNRDPGSIGAPGSWHIDIISDFAEPLPCALGDIMEFSSEVFLAK